MSQSSKFDDDEINLNELSAVIWAHKLLIMFSIAVSVFFSGYYVLNADKKFVARAIFQIEEINFNSGFSLPGELGALASLAGISPGNSNSGANILLERAIGREFILNINNELSIDRDPYFNTYNPDNVEPLWKVNAKKLLGLQKSDQEKKTVIEHNITKNFRKNVKFEKTDGGSLLVSVTHLDPHKASYYANALRKKSES